MFLMSEEKIFWTEFLELYKSFPALWQIKSKEYNNRHLKNSAYDVLIEKLSERDPNANRELVVRKINNFRTLYRRELRRLQQSESLNEEYAPKLWYFELLTFLDEQDDCSKTKTTVIEEDSMESEYFQSEYKPEPKRIRIQQPPKVIQPPTIEDPIRIAEPKDTCLAQSWAVQYNEMDGYQKILARKMISDILFHGCIGDLQVEHTVQLQNIFNS